MLAEAEETQLLEDELDATGNASSAQDLVDLFVTMRIPSWLLIS